MERMVATRAFRYGGARLESGEQFFAKDGHVPYLKKTRRAAAYAGGDESARTYGRRDMRAVQPSLIPSAIGDLRVRYETKFGKKADRRWKEARLRAELENN